MSDQQPDQQTEHILGTGNLIFEATDNVLSVSRRGVTIVMFSGGIDSTYTLVKLLRETNDHVLAHHIHFMNSEGRHQIEAERARRITDYCQEHYRPFTYSQSALDHRSYRFFGYDILGVGFEAGLVARSHLLEFNRMPDRWTIGSCQEEGRNSTRWPHVLACVAANSFPDEPPAYFSFPVPHKADEIEYLGSNLTEMAWTCRRPIWRDGVATECGTCQTCETMKAAKQGSRFIGKGSFETEPARKKEPTNRPRTLSKTGEEIL